jgi:VWFA-related protein
MKCLYLVSLLLFSFLVVNGQQPAQQPDVVRTNTELVQTAVTVVDKKGSFVDGLQREQFELTVDGKPRQVAFFERIASGSVRERELAAAGVGVNSRAPVPAATVLGRTIVFFIDDLHLEPDSLNRTRSMLQHFVDHELSSNDNVAVVSASGQVGFLEQFTNSREVLEAAIGRLVPRQYDANGYSVGSSTKMTEYMALSIDTNKSDTKVTDFYVQECMKGANTFKKASFALAMIRASCETQVKNSARAVLMQAGAITQNTYSSLESLMRYAARAPGRKLAFFVSDGFLLDAGPHAAATRDKLDHVIDAAQRAGVVVYTIHAKGLVNDAFVDPGGKRPVDGVGRLDLASAGELQTYQDALNALAEDTGGRALRNTNFFERWLTNVLDETSNYYLVAWRPETDEEKTPKFRHVKISIAGQPDLSVRAPRGYVAGPTTAPVMAANDTAKPKTPDTEIRDVLTDNRPATALPVQLSLTYLNTPANGLVVTSSLEISGRALTFGDDGKQPATIRLAGVVLNDKGKVAASFRNQLNLNPRQQGEADEGVFYNHHTPLAPGIYQFRVAVRDEKSGHVGSAMQWIVIPDLARNQLTLSSLLLGGQFVEDRANQTTSPQVQLSVDHSFARSSALGYWIFVYNAKRDAGGNPQLTVQTHVLRDGRPLLSSPQRKVTSGGADPQRIPFGEELALKTLAPGRYDLRVTITDAVAGTTTSQVAGFIVR